MNNNILTNVAIYKVKSEDKSESSNIDYLYYTVSFRDKSGEKNFIP